MRFAGKRKSQIGQALGGTTAIREGGMGRHAYQVLFGNAVIEDIAVAIGGSHQGHIIEPTKEAQAIRSSEFTPLGGPLYADGATLRAQPYPEFYVWFVGMCCLRHDDKAPEDTGLMPRQERRWRTLWTMRSLSSGRDSAAPLAALHHEG